MFSASPGKAGEAKSKKTMPTRLVELRKQQFGQKLKH